MGKRIQRKRTKGWKMPPKTVYVGRGSKWGNPCVIRTAADRIHAVSWYEAHVLPHLDLSELVGKDLACWCRLDQICHADSILERLKEVG